MKNTYEALIKQYGRKMIPLESILEYSGCVTLKAARELAVKLSLPFPAFRLGGKKGKWFVNAEELAYYLDRQDLEYRKLYAYKKSQYTNSTP